MAGRTAVGVAVELVSCTRRAVFVRGGNGELVELPTEPRPAVLEPLSRVETVEVDAGGGTLAHVRVADGPVSGTLMLPERREGTWFLVEAPILLRCMHRDDFVTAHGFELDLTEEGLRRPVLSSVQRTLPLVPDGAANITAARVTGGADGSDGAGAG